MKKMKAVFSTAVLSSALFCVTSHAATAAANMHYGKPSVTAKVGAKDYAPTQIINYTPNSYYVSVWFTDGSSDINWVLGPQYSSTGLITIDNEPGETIEVSNAPTGSTPDATDPNLVFGPQWIAAGQNVNVGPFSSTLGAKHTMVSVN